MVSKSQRSFQVGLLVADNHLALVIFFDNRGGCSHGSEFREVVSIVGIVSKIPLFKGDAFFPQPRCFLTASTSPGCRIHNHVGSLIHPLSLPVISLLNGSGQSKSLGPKAAYLEGNQRRLLQTECTTNWRPRTGLARTERESS